MAVTFVLGRAGCGKTRYCVDALLSELDQPADERRLIFLAPEQASFQMERALATRAARGGYWRAEVLSFSRLTQRVLSDLGGQFKRINSHARVMALRCITTRLEDSLQFYRGAARTNGFYRQFAGLLEELLLEDISWQALADSARNLDGSAEQLMMADVIRLYREYRQWLGRERIDPVLGLELLRERIPSMSWLAEASIWVDGFAGFTGQELLTLVALARTARDMTITLLLDPQSPAVLSQQQKPDPLHLFARTEQTYQRLVEMFAAAGVSCQDPQVIHPAPLPRFAETPALAYLEAGLATPIGAPIIKTSNDTSADEVLLRECVTHLDELRTVAGFIRRKMADSSGQLRFRDFAVIARDLEPFAQTIADVFAEYEIPYFLDRRRPMRSHPLSRLIEALFEVVASDFSVAATTRWLRTGLLPLTRESAEELENVVTNHAVHGVTAWQEYSWDSLSNKSRPQDQCGTGFQPVKSQVTNLCHNCGTVSKLDKDRLKLVAAIEPLLHLASAEPTGAEWARVIYEVLEVLDVRQHIEGWSAAQRKQCKWEKAETHRLAWESLNQLLENLHDVLGGTPLRMDEVTAILATALREQTLGLAPPTLDQVLVSSIERSRHPAIKYAWVFAFNEGIFPARPPEDDLLNTEARESLRRSGLPVPASHREDVFGERLLAYIAFTRPSHGLTISYAIVAEDGSPLFPSPLLDDVRRILPNVECSRPKEHPPPVCLTELARGYLQCKSERYERLCAQVRQSGADGGRLDWLLRGRDYHNSAETVGNYRRPDAAGVIWNGSPSEVETYLDCPFKHFAKYGLRLDPNRQPLPLALDLGSFAHEILADVTRRAIRTSSDVRELTDEQWQNLLHDAIADFKNRLSAVLLQQRPELAFQSELLYSFMADVIAVQAERWRRGCFEPLCCEEPFGDPALELQSGIQLHGKIDRIDICRQDDCPLLLVYDYKTSPNKLSGEFLTGARLQLFCYLLAVQAAHGNNIGGVFLAPLYPDLSVVSKKYALAATDREQRMYMYRPYGMFTRQTAALLDEQLGQNVSPVARMKLKKDGDFDSRQSADVVEPEEIVRRLELARETVLLVAKGIITGAVEAAPLVEKHTLACNKCEYGALCRFDRMINQPRAAEAVLPTLDKTRGTNS